MILEEESSIKEMIERSMDIDVLLIESNASYQKQLNLMMKRKAHQIVGEKYVKRRELGNQGAPRKLGNEDETFLAMCVEYKATYHCGRHDLVMYTIHVSNQETCWI